MSIEDIDGVVADAQNSFPRVRITGGAAPEEIHELELLVGDVPLTYKYFLSKYGTFGFYGLEIYGLIKGNVFGEGPPNAYFMTKSDLDDSSIPNRHIVIASTGYGPVFLLNCETGEVVGWNYSGEVDEELPVYASFEAFLEEVTSQTIQDYQSANGAV